MLACRGQDRGCPWPWPPALETPPGPREPRSSTASQICLLCSLGPCGTGVCQPPFPERMEGRDALGPQAFPAALAFPPAQAQCL